MKSVAALTLLFLAAFCSYEAKAECDPLKPCQLIYLPVCGSDGITYGNQCQFDAAAECKPSLIKFSDGECAKAKD